VKLLEVPQNYTSTPRQNWGIYHTVTTWDEFVPYLYQSALCFIICLVTHFSTPCLSLFVWSPRFCFIAWWRWKYLCDRSGFCAWFFLCVT
jgi:hypothetical protein